jgi:hypothetical protein
MFAELTRFAALRFVFEIFFVVELLFARGKGEVGAAIDALECPILKFGHGTILGMEKAKRMPVASPVVGLFDFPARFLPVSLAGKSRLNPFLFSRLQVERVPFDFLNDVFLLHFPLEATERVFQRLPVLESDFSQLKTPPARSWIDPY